MRTRAKGKSAPGRPRQPRTSGRGECAALGAGKEAAWGGRWSGLHEGSEGGRTSRLMPG